MVVSSDPLKIYIFNDGLVRFATQPYQKANPSNQHDRFRHLTNYSLNVKNPDFYCDRETKKLGQSSNNIQKQEGENEEGDYFSHKRSLATFFEQLKSEGLPTSQIWDNIEQVTVKTLCSIKPILDHYNATLYSKKSKLPGCFEILGFDIILNKDLEAVLLEVNHSPSFYTQSEVDLSVKSALIKDTFQILEILHQRQAKEDILDYLSPNIGGYSQIYPHPTNPESNLEYSRYLEAAQNNYNRFTGAQTLEVGKNKKKKRIKIVDFRSREFYSSEQERIYGIKKTSDKNFKVKTKKRGNYILSSKKSSKKNKQKRKNQKQSSPPIKIGLKNVIALRNRIAYQVTHISIYNQDQNTNNGWTGRDHITSKTRSKMRNKSVKAKNKIIRGSQIA